jgi:DNA-damage-inducible protein D
MQILGYKKWERFLEVIQRSIGSCKVSGKIYSDHFFPELGKSTGGRPKENFLLTRYACYLISMNGDTRKVEISLSQLYFASQTRKQELLEKREYENKRLESRKKLKDTEKKIESTVYQRGINRPIEFASFKNKHIEALYGGISTKELKLKKKIPKNRALADFDTDVELRAKDFALAMTDHNIKVRNLKGEYSMKEEVVKNSKATRQTLLSRNIIPENLKTEEDLKKIEIKRKAENNKIKNNPKKMLK